MTPAGKSRPSTRRTVFQELRTAWVDRLDGVAGDCRDSQFAARGLSRGEMKIKKTVTAKVIAANRANGQKATGPRNTTAVTQNARTHGLLSKYILFQGEEEKKEFDTLLDELEREQQPAGPTERALVEELASCFWKVRITNDLENRAKNSFSYLLDGTVLLLPPSAGGNVRSSSFGPAREIPSRKTNLETKRVKPAMCKSRRS